MAKEQLNKTQTPWNWHMFSWDPQSVGRIVSYNMETSDFIWKTVSISILVGQTTTTYTSPFLNVRHCLPFLYHPRISPIFMFSFWRIIRTLGSFGEACVGACTPFSSACSFLSLWEISLVGPVSTLSDAKLFKEIPKCASAWVSHLQQRLCQDLILQKKKF